MPSFRVASEYARLTHVIIGTGKGYHRNPERVEVVNATQAATHASSGHPTAARIEAEFCQFRAALEQAGVIVYEPRLAPDSVQDQTCPRDISFVIGDTFVVAAMRSPSRAQEIEAVQHILADWSGPILEAPSGFALEGGDVVLDENLVFVGMGQRSDPEAAAFLQSHFEDTHQIIPLPCTSPDDGQDILHLDCTFQPLGKGHALLYPDGLVQIPELLRERYQWIEVTSEEARALATNILSVAPDHIIARTHPACARVTEVLRDHGYKVTEVEFDAVPSTGGSFRCATLPLRRG